MRHLICGALAMVLAGGASAANDTITPATDAPRLGTYVLLGGDLTGSQLYVAFSATTTGGRIVLPTWEAGSDPALGFSRTVHGAVDATLIHVLFSQTIHGDVRITELFFSQTVHGNVNITGLAFSQTIHGDVTIVAVKFSQTIHGAVNATIVDIPFSQTIHGSVSGFYENSLDAGPPPRRAIVGGMEWVNGASVRGSMIVDIAHLMDPLSSGPASDFNEGAFLVASAGYSPVNNEAYGSSRWVLLSATPFIMSGGEEGFASFVKIVNSANQPLPITGGEVGAALVSTIPGSRTNSILHSEALDNAGVWGLAAVTIQADAIVGPDGIVSADLVKEDNTNAYHGVDQLITLQAGKPKAISVYAKQKERTIVYIQIYETGGAQTAVQFYDIDSGTLLSTNADFPGLRIRRAKIAPSSVSGEPGWWRCMLVVEPLAGITAYSVGAGLTTTDGVLSYTGTTSSGAYITRVQVEDDEVTVGPYIKTTTVAVTEGSDLLGDVKAEVMLNSGAQNLTLGKESDTQAAVGSWAPGIQAVRRDDPAGGAPSANNDWFLVQGDALGRLWINLGAVYFSQTIHGDVRAELRGDITGAGDLVRWTATTDGQGHVGPHVFPSGILRSASTYAVSVTNAAAVNLFPEALPGATSLIIQNLGTKAVYIGDVNVTATTGVQIGNGGVFTLDLTNEAIVWYAIGTIATAQDLRVGRW